MQTSELEKKKNHLLGDEECINFRPSPNFKHMRKYLKSKFEEANSSPNQNSDPSTTPNSEEHENINPVKSTLNNMAERVQPPLPPNSPPPELVVPKIEIVDEEYNDKPALVSPTNVKEDASDRPAKVMCRQFIRGTCVRGAACIYVHEVILNQLPGVYTFCKNFQNKECKLSKCKFVHASVFEKEHFYRTGYLPPHSLAHLKESNSALAPSKEIDGPHKALPVFPNIPPPALPGLASLPPQSLSNSLLHIMPPAHNMPPLKQGSPIKRDWSEMGPAMAAQEHDSDEPLFKRCKSCDMNELRFQCAKAKADTLMEQLDMSLKQKCQLAKWQNRLNDLLSTAFNSMNPSEPSIARKLNLAISRNEDSNLNQQLNSVVEYKRRFAQMNSQQKVILKQIVMDLLQNQRGSSANR